MKKEKICVYTCMTGNYDSIKEIPRKEAGIDYYCFTNNKNVRSDTWNVVYIEDEKLSNVQLARYIKTLGTDEINENYDILLWMDAAVTFKKPIKEFIETYLTKDTSFVGFKHGERNNIKEEIEACYRFNKEEKEPLQKLMKFYKKENYNYDNGLIESTVYIKRPKDKKVQDTMKLWFDMIKNYTKRDQLSFNYCITKTKLKVKWINEKVFDNDWFLWENHNLNKDIKYYSVYYGNIYEKYSMDLDYHYKYHKKDNKYIISFKTSEETGPIFINLNCLACTAIKDLKISGFKNYEILNSINYKGNTVFFNTFPYIRINDNLKKNKKITISFELQELTEQEKMELVTKLGDETIRLTATKDYLEALNNQKDEQLLKINSRRYFRKLYKWARGKVRNSFKPKSNNN